MHHPPPTTGEAHWRTLYRTAAVAALVTLALIPVQLALYVAYPPPDTAAGFFEMFQANALVGLVALDLLLMVDMLLMALILLALAVALRRTSPSLVVIALFLTLGSVVMYFASSIAFEMLTLSDRYAAATSDADRLAALAAGEAMLAQYTGSAFTVSYVMMGTGGLLLAITMLRSDAFGRGLAWLGIVVNILGLVPPTPATGAVGMVLAFAYLAPFVAWLVLIARRLFRLGRDGDRTSAKSGMLVSTRALHVPDDDRRSRDRGLLLR